jgi:hypothetical protein
MFEDAAGKEGVSVSLRAERNLSTLVHAAESRDVQGSRTTRIGQADMTHVGSASEVRVGAHTGLKMSETGTPDILLSTSGASIRLSGDHIFFEAKGALTVRTGKGAHVSSLGTVDVTGGPTVNINCNDGAPGEAGPPPQPMRLAPADAPLGGEAPLPPPFDPKRAPAPPPPPLGFEEIELKDPHAEAQDPAVAAKRAKAEEAEFAAWVRAHHEDLRAALAAERAMLLAKKAELTRWDGEAQANFEMYFGTTSKGARKVISDRIDAVLARNGRTTPDDLLAASGDDYGPDTFAKVEKDDPRHKIYLSPGFARAPLTGEDSRAGSLVHEMSHFYDVGQTNDVGGGGDDDDTSGLSESTYGAEEARALAKSMPALALKNADNFEYYVEGAKP